MLISVMRGEAARTCQDQEVLNTFPHGVLEEPQILPHSICCALEPLLLDGALAGRKHLHERQILLLSSNGWMSQACNLIDC